ncbi:MAG: hypothetical protein NVSMB64_02620 [Candidatus Velthaea sp.]
MDFGTLAPLLVSHFENKPGFDRNGVHQLASTVATASNTIAAQTGAASAAPSAAQQACYRQCETTRDEALAAAATKGWPFGAAAAAAAVFAFNACRHQCDRP